MDAPRRNVRAFALRLARRRALLAGVRVLALRGWFFLFGGLHYRKPVNAALEQQSVHLKYGELLVESSFMTSASLIISAVASPLVYWITDSVFYTSMICLVALVSACPVLHYMVSAPREYRPSFLGAAVRAVYFVIGTRSGFCWRPKCLAWLNAEFGPLC